MENQTIPASARVIKNIAFRLDQWAAIEAVMEKTGLEFTDTVRAGIACLGEKNGIDVSDVFTKGPTSGARKSFA